MTRRRSGRRIAGIPLRTIVAAELVGAALLLATDVSVIGGIVLVAAAAAVAVAIVMPVRGLRPGSWLAVLAGYATRRRTFTASGSGPSDPIGEPAAVSLPPEVRALFPGITATEQLTRGAGRLGLVHWNGTWNCIVAAGPGDPDVLRLGGPETLPVERVVAAVAGAGLALDAVTVVAQTLVGDPDRLGGGPLAAVAGELGATGRLVRGRQTWFTVRIDPVAAGGAITARGGGVTGLARLAAAAVGRIVSELAGAGLAAEPLGAEAAGRAMAAALLQPPAAEGQPARWIESLSGVASAQVHHRCFAVTSWSDRSLAELAATTGYGLTVAHEVRGLSGGAAELRTVLRLSALSSTQLDRGTTRLRRAARSAGVGLRPLRAQQLAGLRLTVPAGQR